MHRYNVLFLCTGNSARSILAEAILNNVAADKFIAYSAGSHPKGEVHPLALDLLRQLNLPTQGLRSKSWDELAVAGAPVMDFIFTVCDDAAGEACPAWPGHPMTAHWGMPDPAAAVGTELERHRAFHQTYSALEKRITLFADLPIATLDRLFLQSRLASIGRESAGTAAAQL
jgi:arsenate reductase